jgi:hypothetical protein
MSDKTTRLTYADGTTGKIVESRATWNDVGPSGNWNTVTYQGPGDERPFSRAFVRFENDGETTVLRSYDWETDEHGDGSKTHRLIGETEHERVPTADCTFYDLQVSTSKYRQN